MRAYLLPLLVLLAACPRPQQQPQQRPQPRPQPTQPTQQPEYRPPWTNEQPTAFDPELPIDPAKPPPKESLSTGATLELGKPASVMIDGRADIYSASLAAPDPERGGKLPPELKLVPGGGYVTFSSVKGKVGCGGGAAAGADGGTCAGGNTDIRPAGGISGIVDHEKTQFLVGVCLGAAVPVRAPAALDFSAAAKGDSFAELAPVLGQVFFIGDGATNSGLNQRFVIPIGATRCYLGFADAFSFQGPPGAYGDNTGGLSVTLTQAK